jgi:predicted ATPase
MKLKNLTLSGYKSINQEGATISFGDVTVLLGANGVGKSNLVSFFGLVNATLTNKLTYYVAEQGFADTFLNYGSKHTQNINADLEFVEGSLSVLVNLVFSHTTNNTFICHFSNTLSDDTYGLWDVLSNYKVYQFQDTTPNSRIKSQGYIEDNQQLNHDASNLAAFLYRLRENPSSTKYYNRIVRYVQKAMPQFDSFDLEPNAINPKYITLNWREKGATNYLFGPHQISDGSLRFIALATLLLQPENLLPKVIVLDEPELGLHPSAIAYLAGMIKAVSKHSQIIIATQSQRLVDEFEAENIVVVERNSLTNNTDFKRKTTEELGDWLNSYSLGELWEKNVIGGQP